MRTKRPAGRRHVPRALFQTAASSFLPVTLDIAKADSTLADEEMRLLKRVLDMLELESPTGR